MQNFLNSYFQLEKCKTNIQVEFWGGLTSFLASFYIIIVNPAILSQAGLSFSAVCTATILVASLSTILMGLYANNPIVLAPGMGLNAFFTFSVVLGHKISPDIALGVVFWSGAMFIVLAFLGLQEKVVSFIPLHLRYAIACGIGLFISFIGFINGKVVVSHPETLVTMAPWTSVSITFFIALVLTTIFVLKKIRASLILGIICTFLLTIPLGRFWGVEILVFWKGIFSVPDFSLLMSANLKDSFTISLIPTMLAFMFTNLFDNISTLVGVSEAGNLLDEKGNPKNLKKSLVVNSFATLASGVFGTSPTTNYIESAAGVQQGARSGLSSIFAGLAFLPLLFLIPLLEMFPLFATAPILVIVGLFMLSPITKIPWERLDVAIPCFMAITLIPLTFSITNGLVASLGCHYLIVFLNRFKIFKFENN